MINKEREKLKNEIISAKKELLLHYERKPDMAYFDEYLNWLWGSRSSEADDDRALAEVFSPCKKLTSDEDIAGIAIVSAKLLKAWTGLVESCRKLTEKEEKYKDIPIPRKLSKTDLYPCCTFALIRELQHEHAALWLSVKQHDCERFDAACLYDDDAILNIAEKHENAEIRLVLVCIVECRIKLYNVYTAAEDTVKKYRNDIMALADDFFKGTDNVMRSYSIAASLYRQALLPFARQRLKEIEKLMIND